MSKFKLQSNLTKRPPVNNGLLLTTAFLIHQQPVWFLLLSGTSFKRPLFSGPKGGRCTQVWLYFFFFFFKVLWKQEQNHFIQTKGSQKDNKHRSPKNKCQKKSWKKSKKKSRKKSRKKSKKSSWQRCSNGQDIGSVHGPRRLFWTQKEDKKQVKKLLMSVQPIILT